MKLILSFVLLLSLLLVGCGKSREAELVGSWNGPGGALELKEDKTFSIGSGVMGMSGKWSLSGDTVKLSPETVGGKPVAEAKEAAKKQVAAAIKQMPQMKDAIEAQVKLLDGFDLAAAEDNKSLTATLAGQQVKFTKGEAAK